ncbi:LGFP repeat-containing protein [Corynebacterium confusum]
MNKISRRVVAGLAAATLSFGVVACSDAENAANDAKDTAGSAANDATEAAGSAANDADGDDKGESNADDSGSNGDKKAVTTGAGEKEVPADFASAIEDKTSEWGEPKDITEGENGSVATFDDDKLLAYSAETGAQPVIGKIAETWTAEGGVDSKVGLPTAPEQRDDDDDDGFEGWKQSFSHGSIEWDYDDDHGQYEADVDVDD